jgi:DnaJ-class molecular chaperone
VRHTCSGQSDYQILLDNLKEKMCKVCAGRGAVMDADPGDIWFNEYVCMECTGTGLKTKGAKPNDQPR